MSTNAPPSQLTHMERLWDIGQQHLAAGHYVAAARDLEAAEGLAWRRRDPTSLARIYLPLMEARRQIRQNAVEGPLLLAATDTPHTLNAALRDLTSRDAGTLVINCRDACKAAGSVRYAARRNLACLEALIAIAHAGQYRLCSLGDPHFAAGLPLRFTHNPADLVQPQDKHDQPEIPLPPWGRHDPGTPQHAQARESLLVAWEALGMGWRDRHLPPPGKPKADWHTIALLRLALRIDPACEGIMQELIRTAEALARR